MPKDVKPKKRTYGDGHVDPKVAVQLAIVQLIEVDQAVRLTVECGDLALLGLGHFGTLKHLEGAKVVFFHLFKFDYSNLKMNDEQ